MAKEIDIEFIQEESIDTDSEIRELLKDEIYTPLRDTLIKNGIKTIEELRKVKLWPFMNRYNLYSLGQRQTIFTKVSNLLNPSKDLSAEEAFILQVGNESFEGSSPAQAFLLFCSQMFSRHPLQFRLLVGMKFRDGDSVPIQHQQPNADYLEMPSLRAYIYSNLSCDEVIGYTSWICDKCGETFKTILLSRPIKSTIITQKDVEPKRKQSVIELDTEQGKIANINVGKTSSDADVISKIEKFVLQADMDGVSYDDVKNAMNITMASCKQYISAAPHIVNISGKLIHEEAFVDWEEGASQLEEIIDKLMKKNNGYISAAQLYEYARTDLNMFLNDNDINDEQSVFDIARHLFELNGYHDKYCVFSGNSHISKKENAVTSNLQLIMKYAEEKGGVFAFSSLVEYLEGVGIHTGNLRTQMKIPSEPIFFYYVEGLIIYANSMNIDTEWMAAVNIALKDLFTDVGDHIILRDIPEIWFERLPELPKRLPWTALLLQSVLRCYNKELGASTIPAMAGQSLDTLHTMLVSKDCPIRDFGDVVISFLLDNSIKQRDFEAEELRKLLANAGIIQGNELLWNMPKALQNDSRFGWNIAGDHVIVEV